MLARLLFAFVWLIIAAGLLLPLFPGDMASPGPSDGNVGAAHMVITRLRKASAASLVSSIKGDVCVTASFGIATDEPAHEELDAALIRADAALYEAKSAGRNCIRISA